MSTVLWSNSLTAGLVESDHEDLYALYRHLKKLDAICKELKLMPISDFLDSTDMLVNIDQLDMPDDMKSTDELMAAQGIWIAAAEAAGVLGKLMAHVQNNDIRFGLLKNAREDVLEELAICHAFATAAAEKGSQFNLAVIM